jgi:hypothetical protein
MSDIELEGVHKRLDDLKTDLSSLNSAIMSVKEDIGGLKVKVGFWGSVSGGVSGAATAIAFLFFGHGKQ